MSGSIRKRGDRYTVILELGRDSNGKRRQKWIGSFRSQRAAKAFLAEKIHEMSKGAFVEPVKMTVAELCERFLEDYCEHRLKPTTRASYRWLIKKHILPAIGGVALPRLTPLHLQMLYSEKLDSGLSRRTVRYIHAVIHKVIECAVKWGLIGRNVADAVEAPRPERSEFCPLNGEGARQFLQTAKEHRLSAFWLLALTTGMRRGELLGLTWDAVDMERGRVEIRQALVEVNGRPTFTTPKTAKGRRLVELTAMVVQALRKHRLEQKKERIGFGPEYQDSNLVFCQPNGKRLYPNNLSQREYKRILTKAGLPPIRFQDLRHTCATLLLREGVHPKIVQERLGHANIGITLDTYSHVVPGLQREAAVKLEALLGLQGERGLLQE